MAKKQKTNKLTKEWGNYVIFEGAVLRFDPYTTATEFHIRTKQDERFRVRLERI